MDNDEKNQYKYFQETSDLDALTRTLDYYEFTNGSSIMTNETKN